MLIYVCVCRCLIVYIYSFFDFDTESDEQYMLYIVLMKIHAPHGKTSFPGQIKRQIVILSWAQSASSKMFLDGFSGIGLVIRFAEKK